MPRFLLQFTYRLEAWQALVKNLTDREAAFRGLAEQMGGTLTSLDYCFGDYDGVAIFEAPDSKTALSIALAAITPGHLKATKTTDLFSMRALTGALKTAGGATSSATTTEDRCCLTMASFPPCEEVAIQHISFY